MQVWYRNEALIEKEVQIQNNNNINNIEHTFMF